MKRLKITKLLLILTLVIISGCSSSAKADYRMSCYSMTNMDESSYVSLIEIDYEKESLEILDGKFSEKYLNLEKNESNNNHLSRLSDKQNKLDGIDGILVTLDVGGDNFSYEEIWDYRKIDIQTVLQSNEEQAEFMDDDKYSLDKIKAYYTQKEYSCQDEEMK